MSESKVDAKHSPLPWGWYGPTRGEGLTFTHEAHVGPGEGNEGCGGPIAAVSGDDKGQAVANAQFIARACNAHADLLAACRQAAEYVGYTLEFFDWTRFPNLEESAELLRRQLGEALAKAAGTHK